MHLFKNIKTNVTLATLAALGTLSYASISHIPKTALWLSLPSLILIAGLCALALLTTFSWDQLARTARHAKHCLSNQTNSNQAAVFELVAFSKLWFRKQFTLIDREIPNIRNPITQQGLQGIRDGQQLEDLNAVLKWQAQQQLRSSIDAIKIFSSLSTYAPAMGAVVALMHVAAILSSNPQTSDMYQALSAGLICMIYGIVLAHFVFKPFANQLENAYYAQERKQNLILEGIALIYNKRTPAVVRSNLEAMLDQKEEPHLAPHATNASHPLHMSKARKTLPSAI
jgi:chemotaxis protein MotA